MSTTIRLELINVLKPILTDHIQHINNLYKKDRTERKHKVDGIPFDMIRMIDDVIEKGTDDECAFLLIQYTMALDLTITQISDNISSVVLLNDVEECCRLLRNRLK